MKKALAIAGVVNYLGVVFLNAFTDLGHKIIIQNTIFKVYDGSEQIVLTAIVNALVLLPFILIFSPSGFLADRYFKNNIMKYSAVFAVLITLLITLAYYQGWFLFAFILTFLLAAQSAIYGPAKYGYIKELFGEAHISSGNGLVQAVTTVAILSGIIFYTVLFEGMYKIEYTNEAEILQGLAPLGWLLVLGSLFELYLASRLPYKVDTISKRRFTLNKYLSGFYLKKNIKTLRRKKEVFEAVIALGLFWSISQVVLAVFGEYAKSELGVTNTIFVQGVMALAGIGIVIGSIMAANFSKYFINLGLAPLGAIGITILVALIPFVHTMALIAFMFTLFGIFSGFLMVPLNAQIQVLSPRVHLGTVLAGNNFIQNIFMFSFLCLTTVFAYFGMNAVVLFYLMALVGLYLSYLMLQRYAKAMFWSLMSLLGSLRHTYSYEGLENIPKRAGVLLVGNHVSWLDWIIPQLAIERHIHYMMEKDIYHWPVFHWFFQKGEAIPISPRASKDAFKEAYKSLKSGNIVGIFPEGKISEDGSIGKFYRGYEMIPKDYDGVIVPYFIDGLFGSMFAKYKQTQQKPFFKRREVKVYFAPAVPRETTAEELRDIIIKMKEKIREKSINEAQ
jgi:acyl-[acyl-carrier-protein]-phospholipid O-acyltransferase/long-chain-fatty-acid--[acyl-carrier-protein] ligase